MTYHLTPNSSSRCGSVSSRGSAALLMLVLLILSSSLCSIAVWSRTNLLLHIATHSSPREYRPLYLPEQDKVKLVTLGYDRFFSNILWFNTLNYFGKQAEEGRDYKWLAHMCELVTDLNPKAKHAFEFCSTMLAWVAKVPDASTKILYKAIATDPKYWRYQYLLGFNYWYFHENPRRAKDILAVASHLEHAPDFLPRLAARLIVTHDDPSAAVSFLKETLARTKDKRARSVLGEKLKEAQIANDLKILKSLSAKYQRQTGKSPEKLEDLVEAKLLPALPLDPYYQPYYIDQVSKEIKTSSGREALQFKGKTAYTGLAGFVRESNNEIKESANE